MSKPEALSAAVTGPASEAAKESAPTPAVTAPKRPKPPVVLQPAQARPLLLGLVAGQAQIAIPDRQATDILPIELLLNGEPIHVLGDQRHAAGTTLSFNLLYNSALEPEEFGWQLMSPEAGGFLSVDYSDEWRLYDGHTGYIAQRPIDKNLPYTAEYSDAHAADGVVIRPGGRYLFSGLFGLHRCKARVVVKFLSDTLDEVGKETIDIESDRYGGTSASDYEPVEFEFTVPRKARLIRLQLTKLEAFTGADSSMMLFSNVKIESRAVGAQPVDTSRFALPALAGLRQLASGPIRFANLPLPAGSALPLGSELDVRFGPGREQALGAPLKLERGPRLTGDIEGVKGFVLQGTVSAGIQQLADRRVWLYSDGKLIGSVEPSEPVGTGGLLYRFGLSADLFDGRLHVFTARSSDGQTVGERAELVPFHLVPWESIEKYAGRPLPSAMAPMAQDRYLSLQKTLRLFKQRYEELSGEDPASAELLARQLAQVPLMHDVLVEGYSGRWKSLTMEFPPTDNPLVSIIIPVHNKWPVTRHCLAGLLVAGNKASFEVIVVDDGSSDETLDIAKHVKNIVYVRNEKAQGFIVACNRGAEQARGRYVVFLNNDTEPTAGWLDELVSVFEDYDNVGLAGSKLLYPNGELQEAGGIVWGTGDPWNYGRKANPHDPRFCYLRQADYVSGASLMLPTDLWRQIGGFSEELIPAYFEDTDLAFKVRHAGKKVVYVPHSVVYHYEGMSSGTSTASGMKRFQEVNRPKFKRKWLTAYARNGEVGVDVDLAKDRGIQRRALVIDVSTPKPDNDAGSYAAIQEIRLLQSFGFKVTFVPENMAYLGRDSERLMRMGVETIYAPFYQSVEDFLEKRGKEFELVYVTRYYTARKIVEPCRRLAKQAAIMFCNADLHFLRQMRDAMAENDENLLRIARETRDMELAVCGDVDVVLSYSNVEHAVLESYGIPSTKVRTCPWVVDPASRVPGFDERKDIAYLGGFGHGPNRAAVLHFIENVMPQLRKRLPGVKFRIYGSGATDALKDVDTTDVIVEGFVEDTAEAYDSCRVFVAPLLTGAGLKGKVVSALARGTPSVISPVAAEGTQIRDGKEGFIVRDIQSWVDNVVTLYTDRAAWEEMSENALSLAKSAYSFEHGRKLMEEALEVAGIYVDQEGAYLHNRGTMPQ